MARLTIVDRQDDDDVAADDEDGQPDGDPRDEPAPGIVRTMNALEQQQLVGHRVEPGPERRLLPRAPGDEAVERVGDAGRDERGQRPPELAVQHQDHERRDEQHPEQRDLVRDGERRHLYFFSPRALDPVSFSRRATASTASAPVTGRVGSNAPAAPASRTRVLTARLAASNAGWVAGEIAERHLVFRPAPRAWRIDCARPGPARARRRRRDRRGGCRPRGWKVWFGKASITPARRTAAIHGAAHVPETSVTSVLGARGRGVQQGRKPHAEQRGEIATCRGGLLGNPAIAFAAASRGPRDRAARPGARRPPACVRSPVPLRARSSRPRCRRSLRGCRRSAVASPDRPDRASPPVRDARGPARPDRRDARSAASSRSSRALSGEATRACSYASPGLVQLARGCRRPRLRHGIVHGTEPQCLDASRRDRASDRPPVPPRSWRSRPPPGSIAPARDRGRPAPQPAPASTRRPRRSARWRGRSRASPARCNRAPRRPMRCWACASGRR